METIKCGERERFVTTELVELVDKTLTVYLTIIGLNVRRPLRI